tara:strand:+ start:727 stop:1758 length:1032 start_codon:yes stop_codon:yes gene_type:complete
MRFYKDSNKIYFDSAKACPFYFELLKWRTNYEKKSLIKKSEIRINHKCVVENVKDEVSGFFNVKNGDVFFNTSFTQSFQSLINELKRDPIFIVLKDDYPSISDSIKKNDHKIIYVKNDQNIEKNLENAVKKYNPDFLAISIVQWIDGIKVDLDFLKSLKSNNKNLTIIGDGTQFCGTCKFNFDKSPFDVLISSGYKWMYSGYGIAFILVKHSFYKNKFVDLDKVKMKESFEMGHYDMLAIGSLSFSLKKLKKSIYSIEKKLIEYSKMLICELIKLEMINQKIKNRKQHSTIFNIHDPNGRLYKFLSKNNFICSQRGNGVRLSFNFFNTKSEIKTLIQTLKKFN